MSDTLIRVWADYSSAPMTAFVDWDDGHFSLPDSHPIAQKLWGSASRVDYRVTVYSTDELEWVVDGIRRTYSGQYHIVCTPRMKQLRAALVSDDYLIEVWLSAEKKWQKDHLEHAALVDELSAALFEAVTRISSVQYPWSGRVARELIDSGWRKADPA